MQFTGQLINSPNPRHQLLGSLHSLTIDCIRGQGADSRYLRQAEHTDVTFVTIAEAQALTQLSRALGTANCGAIVTDGLVADRLSHLLDSLDQPDEAQGKWMMRASLASMYLHAGRWEDAQKQAELAWRPPATDSAIGGMLVGIYLHNGNSKAAQRTLDELKLHVQDYELVAMHQIDVLQTRIDAATTQSRKGGVVEAHQVVEYSTDN